MIGLFATLLSHGVSASAASWYLDNMITNSANNGASWANAWTNFGSVLYGGSHHGGVAGGDTLYISGGTTSQVYPVGTNWYTLAVGSGTDSNHLVTIAPGQDAGHNGIVIFDGLGAQTADCFLWVGGTSWAKITGHYNGQSHFLFRNIYRLINRDMGHAINGSPRHCVFEYITVTNCGNGFRFVDADDLEVAHCDMRYIRADHCIMAFGGGESFDRFRIHDNYLQSNTSINAAVYGGGPDGIQPGAGATIYNNEFQCLPLGDLIPDLATVGKVATTQWQHPDCIQGGQNYLRVFNNLFHGPINACYSGDPPGPVMRDYYFFNNVFVFDQPKYIVGGLFQNGYVNRITSISNIYWINNTVVGFRSSFGWEWDKTLASQPVVSNLVFLNNLFYTPAGTYAVVAFGTYLNTNFGAASVVASSNLVYPPRSYMFHTGGSRLGNYNFGPVPSGNRPAFVNYIPFSTNSDFHLATNDTAATGQGTNLTTLANSLPGLSGLASDKDGNARPTTGLWTIGAYHGLADK